MTATIKFMPKTTKTERNKDLVLKRYSNPKKWGWGELGKLYGIHRQYAKDIFERDHANILTTKQIEAYKNRLAKL